MILSAPASIREAIILSESTSGTYLDGNAFSSLIGLAGFLLPRVCCCHGFGWGCAAVFAMAPSVLGVSWVENAVIPLIFSPGGGIHPAATPPSPRWHTSTQIPAASSDTQLDTKEDCCVGMDMVHQFEGKIMSGKLNRFA